MTLFFRIVVIISLIISYKFLPVFEPKGINYILSLICLLIILFELKKVWKAFDIETNKKYKIQKILYFFVIILIFTSVIFIMHKENPASNIRFIRGILMLLTLGFGAQIVRLIFNSQLSNSIKNSILFLFSTISLIAIIECVFMFVSLSHGSGEAYSGKIWMNKYWNPINQYGFRDEKPKNETKNVFFIGDSFTAGWGVKNINNRFGEITAKTLLKKGKKINEINLGRYGADTKLEFHILKTFIKKSKIKPQHIVLQYFVNDMDKFIPTKNCPNRPLNISNYKNILTNGSYLINYINSIYPTVNSYKLPKECEYTERLRHTYSNDSIWEREVIELDKFKHFCKESNITMILVFFPFMEDLELAKNLGVEKRIVSYCLTNKIPLLNVTSLIRGLTQKQRQASIVDAHASDHVHKIVGEKLASFLN